MTVVDFLIIALIIGSVIVGGMRGFVREAISIAALLIAIFAALRFGAQAGSWLDGTLGSPELEIWAGRILVFVLIVALGALAGWAFSRMVRLAGLTGTDRTLGGLFGFARGAVIVGLLVMLGRYAAMDSESWWRDSALMPYAETIADWIEIMAPRGMEILQPEQRLDELQLAVPDLFRTTRGGVSR